MRKELILTINVGSSTIKFAIFRQVGELRRELTGKIDRIGYRKQTLTIIDATGNKKHSHIDKCSDNKSAANYLINWLEERIDFSTIQSVGHRVVFGMKHTKPMRVTPKLLRELRGYIAHDHEHLPGELELMEVFYRRHPALPQVAFFDTAFHSAMPVVARLLPIPRRYFKRGLQRYGFHGLSYTYLMRELSRLGGAKEASGKVILLHLGSGASLVAVHKGKSIDTSMGFTPSGGLPMGTRSGDLDPGVASAVMNGDHLSPSQFNLLMNDESGLLGMSETSSDMRDLLKRRTNDSRAREAVDVFCYQAKKWIGAFSAVLGGLDTVVFAGGIGENAPTVRAQICDGLGFLGIKLDKKRNAANEELVSTAASQVDVRVIPTDEELMIARLVRGSAEVK